MILESRINIPEAEHTENPIQVLINELERIKYNPTDQHLQAVKNLAFRLANIQNASSAKKIKGVYWSQSKSMWFSEVKRKGKTIFMKYSKNKEDVCLAYKEFIITLAQS